MAAVVETTQQDLASSPALSSAEQDRGGRTSSSSERVSTQRHLAHYFHTYTDDEAGTAELVKATGAAREAHQQFCTSQFG